jgi:putative peptidoglycan lipid II flippase
MTSHVLSLQLRAMMGVALSRLSGVLRVVLLNTVFGANTTLDAFNVAFRLPNTLREFFAEGALASAILKPMTTLHASDQLQLVQVVSGFFLCITLLTSIICMYYAKAIIYGISSHYFIAIGAADLSIQLFRILIFFVPISMLNAVYMVTLNVHGKPFQAMYSSIWSNIGVIAVVIAVYQWPSIRMVSYGVLLGGLLQMVYQWRWMRRIGYAVAYPVFSISAWWKCQSLRNILRLMAPRTLTQGSVTVGMLLTIFLTTQMAVGSVTYMATAFLLIQVPIGLFGIATGFASLPILSKTIQMKKAVLFSQLIHNSLELSLWLSLLCSIAFALLMLPFYIILFQHGAIHLHDSIANVLAICAYTSGIAASAANRILLNGLYALGANRQTVITSLTYLAIQALLNITLAPTFQLVGLGFAFGLGSIFNLFQNYHYFVTLTEKRFEVPLCPYTFKRILSYVLLSFSCACIGLMMTSHGWPYMVRVLHFHFNSLSMLVAFMLFGTLLFSIFIVLTWYAGPTILQRRIKALLRLFKARWL